jgi:preprotein translocase subunit SecD
MRNKRVNIIIFIAFILLIGVSIYYIAVQPINLGLDLKGGTQIILRPVEGEESQVTAESLDKAMLIIMDRIDRLGISEPLVTRDISNNIVIQLPGVGDPDRAVSVIGRTAQLEFRILEGTLVSRRGQETEFVDFDPDTGSISYGPAPDEVILVDNINSAAPVKSGVLHFGEDDDKIYLMDREFEFGSAFDPEMAEGVFEYDQSTRELILKDIDSGESLGEMLTDGRSGAASLVGPVLLTGDKLARASAGYDSTGQIIVSLSFKQEGVNAFEDITTNNIGEQLAIVLDEEIKSAPFINVPISGGDAVIEGINSLDEANDITLVLQTGALPVNLVIEESSTVGPTLGRDALDKGLYAGLIGFVLIIIFMTAYYRGLGLISVLGLLVYVALFWGILAGIGAALTLPGIAGIILTIGMAVDANVIIFARIREEARKGKSTRIAIGDGFRHALSTIVDANVTTLITAAALYSFGTGPIKGFAVTLALGVVLSMLISLLFTRSVLFTAAGLHGLARPSFIGVRKKEEQ